MSWVRLLAAPDAHLMSSPEQPKSISFIQSQYRNLQRWSAMIGLGSTPVVKGLDLSKRRGSGVQTKGQPLYELIAYPTTQTGPPTTITRPEDILRGYCTYSSALGRPLVNRNWLFNIFWFEKTCLDFTAPFTSFSGTSLFLRLHWCFKEGRCISSYISSFDHIFLRLDNSYSLVSPRNPTAETSLILFLLLLICFCKI